ncbi:MAG: hypothetical protein IAI49_07550, partial [Candidatus Eremiobacteraeota bacterium]|nr:hypothetical protein [Candidatus Eremiobacteraeota bacterium]
AERLPDYMIPSAIVALDRFPLTRAGKIDRNALPDPVDDAAGDFVGPRTPTEATIAAIWSEILDVERVSVAAEFTSLGFHSILAIRALDTVSRTFGVRVPIRSFFDSPTIERFAAVVDAQIASAAERRLEEALARVSDMTDEEAELLLQRAGTDVSR